MFQTGLAAGDYYEVMSGEFAGGACTGATYTVDGSGKVTATVMANWPLALRINAHTSGTPPPNPRTCTSGAATFEVVAPTAAGESIHLVGSLPEMGGWNTAAAVPMAVTGGVSLPMSTGFEYGYLRKAATGQVTWEYDLNRTRTTPGGCAAVTWTET